MATRRQCRNRKKKRPLSERSEFRTLPDFGTSDVAPSTGISLQPQLQRQQQISARTQK